MKRYVYTTPSKRDSLYNLLEYQKKKHYLISALPTGILGGVVFSTMVWWVKPTMLMMGSIPLTMGLLFTVFGAFFYGIAVVSQLKLREVQCDSVQKILQDRVKKLQKDDPQLGVTVDQLTQAVSTKPKSKCDLGYVNEVYFQTQQNEIRVIREHVDEDGNLLHYRIYTKEQSRWHQMYYVKDVIDEKGGKRLVLRKKVERR